MCWENFKSTERVAVEISSGRNQKIRTFDLYACVLVRNVFQRCADLMRIKLGLRLKKGDSDCFTN